MSAFYYKFIRVDMYNIVENRKKVIMDFVESPMYVPMKEKELATFFGIEKAKRYELKEVLQELLLEGKLEITKRGKYKKSEKKFLLGEFIANQRGFGFVKVEGRDSDIFIPAEYTSNAMNGDTVKVVIDMESGEKKAEGHIIGIEKHANSQVVGYYQKSNRFGFVLPDDTKIFKDIYIPQGKGNGAKTGDKVVVDITDFGNDKKKPEGRVVEILGKNTDIGVDILSIARSFGLPEKFGEEVENELKSIPKKVLKKDIKGRADFRDKVTVTIDGEDAKDLDDAITLEKNGNVWHLGVHIADVTHYVRENTALDKEALQRATSVYLVDRVIPMLPKKLSNGICSLNQGEDRLALSCMMEIDEKGNIIGHNICESVINVNERMTYTAVNEVITNSNEETEKRYAEYIDLFKDFKTVSDLLRGARTKRGSIDFDLPESKVILDKNGRAIDIKPYERNSATKLIEDFMLAANETVAEDFFWQDIPFLYRVHENPDPDKMKSLAIFINNFGFTLRRKNDEVPPKEIQKLLANIEGSDAEPIISRIALRSMKRARYDTVCIGHFGLAAKYYTHFTSPIRRYPDLQIHRIIKENIRNGLSGRRIEHYRNILDDVALQSSKMERRAEEAERETVKYKKCEYMLNHIGEEFDGIISGVTGFGIFVELENTVEGFIRMSDLEGDYFEYNEAGYELVGEFTKKKFVLGQKVRVKVYDIDRLAKRIDFKLVKEKNGRGY